MDQTEVEVQLDDCEAEKTSGNGNPFIPGGAISEDGAKILELWRLDRLGQYGNNCHQEGEMESESLQQTLGGDETRRVLTDVTPAVQPVVTLQQKKEKIKSLCCFPA